MYMFSRNNKHLLHFEASDLELGVLLVIASQNNWPLMSCTSKLNGPSIFIQTKRIEDHSLMFGDLMCSSTLECTDLARRISAEFHLGRYGMFPFANVGGKAFLNWRLQRLKYTFLG